MTILHSATGSDTICDKIPRRHHRHVRFDIVIMVEVVVHVESRTLGKQRWLVLVVRAKRYR
jgi:hypothetical protein